MDRHFRRRIAAWLAAALVLAAGIAAPGLAATDSAEVASQTFAGGFPSGSNGEGPTGVAFDALQQLYVVDGGSLYRFGPDGGDAASHTLGSGNLGRLAGLAFAPSGALYATRWIAGQRGDVVQLDPATGAVTNVVATGLLCPTGLAVDPVSGDLFVSEVWCAKQILRISGGQASTYVSGVNADGLTFGPDGTLYLAHQPDANGNTISMVTGTRDRAPGTRTGLAAVPQADGIALSAATVDGGPAFLIVNRRDGTISRVELTGAHQTRDLRTGGTRGDFVAVAPDGCLYATQTSEIVKVTNRDGTCRREATPANVASGLGAGLSPTLTRAVTKILPRSGATCSSPRRLITRYRARRGVRVTSARIYIGRRLARRVSGRALRRGVTVRSLPKGRFTLVIRARTNRRHTIVVRRRYGACAGRRA